MRINMATQRTIDGIQISAIVAGRQYLRVPHLWLDSIRHAPLTRAGLTLPDPTGEEIQRIAKGDAVTFIMAYRGEAASYWQGEVTWTKPGTAHQVEMGLVGNDAAFSRCRFTAAWLHETPEAILTQLLSQAGISAGTIAVPGLEIPRFAVSNENLWQIVEKLELTCARAFGSDMSAWALWMDESGLAHWGDFDAPEQTEVPSVITGQNLIAHTPATNAASLSMVETFLLPSLRHSYQFTLHDMYRGVSGTFRAEKVRTEADGTKARTYIWYGKERSRY